MPKRAFQFGGVNPTKRFRPSAITRSKIRPFSGRGSGGRRQAIGQILGVENKYFDSLLNAHAIVATVAGSEADPTGSLDCLNAIAQDDGESDRDGRKCRLSSLQFKGFIQPVVQSDLDDVQAPTPVRIVVYTDSQTNGLQSNAEDVLKDVGAEDILSLRNPKFQSRFNVLFDQLFDPGQTQTGTDGSSTLSSVGNSITFDFFKKLNMEVNFSGTTSDIANITDNSIHVLAIARDAGRYLLNYQTRVRFVG